MTAATPTFEQPTTERPRRRVLITGANRGIGLSTARELVRTGCAVVLTSRDEARGLAAAADLRADTPGADVDVRSLDLASFWSIRKLAADLLKGPPIDVLVHNAGVVIPSPERKMTEDGVEECLQVHTVGPMLLTSHLAPRLARPCRIVLVGSGLHAPGTHGREVHFDFDDPFLDRHYHPDRAYKNAKLAQLWFAFEWERRFGARGLHADVVCPGFVPLTAAASSHGLQRLLLEHVYPWLPFATTLEKAAHIEAEWALHDPGSPGGRYFDAHTIAQASADARDPEKAAAFWKLAETWIGEPLTAHPPTGLHD